MIIGVVAEGGVRISAMTTPRSRPPAESARVIPASQSIADAGLAASGRIGAPRDGCAIRAPTPRALHRRGRVGCGEGIAAHVGGPGSHSGAFLEARQAAECGPPARLPAHKA